MDSLGNLCARVRESAHAIMNYAKEVSIDYQKLGEYCDALDSVEYVSWKECHFDHSETALESLLGFIFVTDSLNFCFWPTPGFEYDHLTSNLNKLLEDTPDFFSPLYLSTELTPTILRGKVFGGKDFALLEERTKILKGLGTSLLTHFKG